MSENEMLNFRRRTEDWRNTYALRQQSVTQATSSLSSAEAEAKAVTQGCTEGLYAKNLLDELNQRFGPGRTKVQIMRAQRKSKQTIMMVHNIRGDEFEADAMTTLVPLWRFLDKLSGSTGVLVS